MNKNLPDWLQGAEEPPLKAEVGTWQRVYDFNEELPPSDDSIWYSSPAYRVAFLALSVLVAAIYFGSLFLVFPYERAFHLALRSTMIFACAGWVGLMLLGAVALLKK